MKKIKITKIFSFEMAHALWNYDGKCRNIHGHSYFLHVSVEGIPLNEHGHPNDGMVLDFGQLKKIVTTNIIDVFDHALVINSNDNRKNAFVQNPLFENIIELPFQPTSENLVCHFADLIKSELPKNLELSNLKLQETETSFVEWSS